MVTIGLRTHRWVLGLASVICCGMLVASCSSGSSGDPPKTASTSPTPADLTTSPSSGARDGSQVRDALITALRENQLSAVNAVPPITLSAKTFGTGVDTAGTRWILTGFTQTGVIGRQWLIGAFSLVTEPAGFIDVRVFTLPVGSAAKADDCQVPWTRNFALAPATTTPGATRPCQTTDEGSGRTVVVCAYSNLREMYLIEPGIVVAVSTGSGMAISASSETLGTTAPPISADTQLDIVQKLGVTAKPLP